MKKLAFSLSLLVLGATAASADPFFVQLEPTTPDSTINCANFHQVGKGIWLASAPVPFSLGIIHGIVPPRYAFKSGMWIYNNVDLAMQLDAQCGAGPVVRARY